MFLETDCPFLCYTTRVECVAPELLTGFIHTVGSPATRRDGLVRYVLLSKLSSSHFNGVQDPKDFLSATTHRYSCVFFAILSILSPVLLFYYFVRVCVCVRARVRVALCC